MYKFSIIYFFKEFTNKGIGTKKTYQNNSTVFLGIFMFRGVYIECLVEKRILKRIIDRRSYLLKLSNFFRRKN